VGSYTFSVSPPRRLPLSSPSQLDYGSVVYGSARKSFLKTFDPIHTKVSDVVVFSPYI
jgi:hypothetical protein